MDNRTSNRKRIHVQKSLFCVLFLFCLRNRQRKARSAMEACTNSASGDRNFMIVPNSLHVYKEIKNISPAGSQYYTENSAIHKYYTRQNSNLHLPQCRTSLKQNTISFQGPILWNALSDKIKSCQSLNIFKRKLKLFLLSELL